MQMNNPITVQPDIYNQPDLFFDDLVLHNVRTPSPIPDDDDFNKFPPFTNLIPQLPPVEHNHYQHLQNNHHQPQPPQIIQQSQPFSNTLLTHTPPTSSYHGPSPQHSMNNTLGSTSIHGGGQSRGQSPQLVFVDNKSNRSDHSSPGGGSIKRKQITGVNNNIHPNYNVDEHTPQQIIQNIQEESMTFLDIEIEEEKNPLLMNAPPLVVDENSNVNGNKHNYQSQFNDDNNINNYGNYVPPTPKNVGYDYHLVSPRAISTRTNPSKISDPTLVQSALQSVAYYADKITSLHGSYEEYYEEQQKLRQIIQNQNINHQNQLTNHPHPTQQYHYLSQILQDLISKLYYNFCEMKSKLDMQYQLVLDPYVKNEFHRFQRFYETFANTQSNLICAAQQQQTVYKQSQSQAQPQPQSQYNNGYNNNQQQQPQVQQQPQQQQQYSYPQTPSHYQTMMKQSMINNQNNNNNNGVNTHYNYLAKAQQTLTPRHNQISPPQHRQQFGATNQQRSYSTNAINSNERSFGFSLYHQRMAAMNNNQKQRPSETTRPNQMYNNNYNSQKKQKNNINILIPQMGYVYIGSRMSQLISQMSSSETDIIDNKNRIQSILNKILSSSISFKGFDIVSYGSTEYKLFIKDYSNFDFCIRCKDLKLNHNDAIQYIVNSLRAPDMQKSFKNIEIISVDLNKISPIYGNKLNHIKLVDIQTKKSINLILNDIPCIGSSRFIAGYESIDNRFHLLCRVVKYWARRRALSISSYALCLMVINFLQSTSPRLLPTLSVMVTRETGLSPWSTRDDYQINEQKFKDMAQKNEESHSKLLVNFFKYYGHKFDYNNDVVSVRTGTWLTKSDKKWIQDENQLCVENPFDSRMNLTKNINKKELKKIQLEFKRAYQILCDSYQIYEVCNKIEKE